MYLRSLCPLAVGLTLACQQAAVDADREQCEDVTAQIEQALLDYAEAELLLPGAVPCELTTEAFDPRAEPHAVEYLLDAFARACEVQAEACWGIAGPSSGPPSPVLSSPPSAPPPAHVTSSAPE